MHLVTGKRCKSRASCLLARGAQQMETTTNPEARWKAPAALILPLPACLLLEAGIMVLQS